MALGRSVPRSGQAMKSVVDSNLPPSVKRESSRKSASDFLRSVLSERYTGGLSSARPARARSSHNIQDTVTYAPIPEDAQEEILKLKRQLLSVNNDNGLLKTRLRKLESNLARKEKELDDLLDSGQMITPVADGRQRLLTHSMKQKILRLEQSLRDKELALNKLKSDLKSTRIEELRVQLDVMYNEILRLRQSAKQGLSSTGPVTNSDELPSDIRSRLKSMNETIQKLNATNQQLTNENRLLNSKHQEITEKQKQAEFTDEYLPDEFDRFAKMSRKELVVMVRDLEKDNAGKRRDDAEKNIQQLKNDYESRIKSMESQNRRLTEMESAWKDEKNQLRQKLSRKQRVIDKLKQELNTLKNVSGHENRTDLDNDLSAAEDQQTMKTSKSRRFGRKIGLQQQQQSNLSSSSSIRRRADEANLSKLNVDDRQRLENLRRGRAAKTIQRNWRRFNNDKDEAASIIESAIRGHNRRTKALERSTDGQRQRRRRQAAPGKGSVEDRATDHDRDNNNDDDECVSLGGIENHSSDAVENGPNKDDDDDDDDAVSLINAAVRGHVARERELKNFRPSISSADQKSSINSPSIPPAQTNGDVSDNDFY